MLNYREYLEVPLLTPLDTSKLYCVEFYVSLADIFGMAISNLGVYFSNDSLTDGTNMNTIDYIVPQLENPIGNILNDTTNWMLVSGTYTAIGGERFMTIGNFHLASNTNAQVVPTQTPNNIAYYYIDDISVTDCTTIGISETNNQPSSIEISPNPATSEIKITTTNAVIKEAHIYTMMGQCIQQSTIANQQLTLVRCPLECT